MNARPWQKIAAAAPLRRRIQKLFSENKRVPGTALPSFGCRGVPLGGTHLQGGYTMKTVTTLTAVAALIAGISIASAQSMNSPSSQSGKPQATGSGKFCIEVSKGAGSVQCKYASMTACEKDAQAQGLQCSPNPNSGTTGSKN
jgi:hypothetical protein